MSTVNKETLRLIKMKACLYLRLYPDYSLAVFPGYDATITGQFLTSSAVSISEHHKAKDGAL